MHPMHNDFHDLIERALAEDLPDITTDSIFEPDEKGSATFLAKAEGVVAGLTVARAVFRRLDSSAELEALVEDGSTVTHGTELARVKASVRALLSGERTALNLLQRASGIATTTRRYVDAVAGTRARILDTRKTAPGLRTLDKYAVRTGGGENHRIGLFDMFLIKNNHIDRAGSIRQAVAKVRASGRSEKIMVEVRDFDELAAAIAEEPDSILLDNMTVADMAEAVRRTPAGIELEASGGVTLESVAAIARTGVHRISVGALTHSVTAMDISMRIAV